MRNNFLLVYEFAATRRYWSASSRSLLISSRIGVVDGLIDTLVHHALVERPSHLLIINLRLILLGFTGKLVAIVATELG